jgi:hypothetical protein
LSNFLSQLHSPQFYTPRQHARAKKDESHNAFVFSLLLIKLIAEHCGGDVFSSDVAATGFTVQEEVRLPGQCSIGRHLIVGVRNGLFRLLGMVPTVLGVVDAQQKLFIVRGL